MPKHIDENKITLAVKPAKDVDGFHPVNMGKMMLGLDSMIPATPAGIIELIKRYIKRKFSVISCKIKIRQDLD